MNKGQYKLLLNRNYRKWMNAYVFTVSYILVLYIHNVFFVVIVIIITGTHNLIVNHKQINT